MIKKNVYLVVLNAYHVLEVHLILQVRYKKLIIYIIKKKKIKITYPIEKTEEAFDISVLIPLGYSLITYSNSIYLIIS